MKPTIGRIVIYHTTEQDKTMLRNTGNESNELPAIIVCVWNDTCVNLQVIADGNKNIWKTSVIEGNKEGNWSWPTREGN